MASTTNYVEIQQNEIDALQSIFMEDFVEDETKAGPWNVGCNTSKGRILSCCLLLVYSETCTEGFALLGSVLSIFPETVRVFNHIAYRNACFY